MGIDYSACYADVIEWQAVCRIVPAAAAQFTAVLGNHQGPQSTTESLRDSLCRMIGEDLWGDPENKTETPQALLDALDHYEAEVALPAAREILDAFGRLGRAFEAATTVGDSRLQLSTGYHDSQNQGCRGDEIDGAFLCVEGAWGLTPAGRKFKDVFTRKSFTAWG